MTEQLKESQWNCPFHQKNTTCMSRIRMFASLPEKEQSRLLEHAVHSVRKKGDVIAAEGDVITSVIIIRKGRIKTCRIDANGNEYILDILHDGHAIWHDMFLKDAVYHYSVVCLTDVQICEIPREELVNVLRDNPEAAMSLITMLSTDLYEAKEKSILLSIHKPMARLAGFLLNRDRTCINSVIHMKLEDIASSLSLRPETVSRNLSVLEKEGIIRRSGKGKLQVINRSALQKIYEEEKK